MKKPDKITILSGFFFYYGITKMPNFNIIFKNHEKNKKNQFFV